VTNRQYGRFLDHVRENGDEEWRHPDQSPGKSHRPEYWDDARFNDPDQPVVGVDWFDAYAYAQWAGKHLPSGQQWERAARGQTKRIYPWGDPFYAGRCVCAEANATAPASARSHSAGQSPDGLMHMTGNVMEWTAEDYPAGEGRKVLRGGSWKNSCEIYGLVFTPTLGAPRTYRGEDVGFRCVGD
jgi:formylglycine-generating enzyme required for sulfatase activity